MKHYRKFVKSLVIQFAPIQFFCLDKGLINRLDKLFIKVYNHCSFSTLRMVGINNED